MSSPTRKGYRAAISYAAGLDAEAPRRAVTGFLAWFYDRSPERVLADVQRSTQIRDDELTHPSNRETAKVAADRFVATRETRETALADIDKIIQSVEQQMATGYSETEMFTQVAALNYWRAVRRIVDRQLVWRITP